MFILYILYIQVPCYGNWPLWASVVSRDLPLPPVDATLQSDHHYQTATRRSAQRVTAIVALRIECRYHLFKLLFGVIRRRHLDFL